MRDEPPAGRGAGPDAVVIGGGIVGVSAAAHLARTGRRVTLVERADLAAGASGRNSGVVQQPFDAALTDLHVETLERYRELAGHGPDATFRLPPEPAGLLLVTHDPAVAAGLTDDLTAAHPGLDPTFLGPGEARRLEPALGPEVAACRVAIGYPVAPAAATRATAAWAADMGVMIRTGVEARPWLVDGRCHGVVTGSGDRIAAPDVVIAAGPWSPALVDPSGRWRPIRPLWGVVVLVELESPPGHVLEEAEISIEPGQAADPAGRIDFSLVTAGGASSLGSTFLPDEPDAAALVPAIAAHGARFVPAIAGARLGAVRVCARPLSLDGRPLVGAVPGLDGLWIAAGHGPWGISTGPASGRLVADLVDGTVGAPPSAFDPARFGAPPG